METSEPSRIEAQMAFLLAADGLKGVVRASSIADGSRRENSAEHSWHAALMALVLAEHATEKVDMGQVIKLLLVHDLVEVYAGDTAIYDVAATKTQPEREEAAARKLFGVLPEDQGAQFSALWHEFEARETPESRFARAVDALAPTWLHWGEHANPGPEPLTATQILTMKEPMLAPYPEFITLLNDIVASALKRGLIEP